MQVVHRLTCGQITCTHEIKNYKLTVVLDTQVFIGKFCFQSVGQSFLCVLISMKDNLLIFELMLTELVQTLKTATNKLLQQLSFRRGRGVRN